jgi:tyrosyl-tRNA synthetase
MDPEISFELITRHLPEVHGKQILKKIIDARPLEIYWGTAPTGKIHLGYFVPALKIADFLQAGCNVTVLIADWHAYLEESKSSPKLETLEKRSIYYETMIKEMLKILNVDISRIKFVRGTSFQFEKAYTMDKDRFARMTTVKQAQHAGAEVVKQSNNPYLTCLMYPIMQALDEVHLHVDAQFGGIDQRKIFMFAREHLPKLGKQGKNPMDKGLKYHKRIHLMNEMVPGITLTKHEETKDDSDNISTKMSASNAKTKIDLLAGSKAIKKVINGAYCLEGDAEDNSLMVILEKVIFRILTHKKEKFLVHREEEYGGNIFFDDIESVKKAFSDKTLHPQDFKNGISHFLAVTLKPIRDAFSSKEMQKLVREAYK